MNLYDQPTCILQKIKAKEAVMQVRAMVFALPIMALMFAPDDEGGGCGKEEVDNSTEAKALAEDAGEANGAGDASTALASIPALNLKTAADVTNEATAAKAASTNMGVWFKPAGCIKAVQSGALVTYTFSNCTGPLGLVAVNGKLEATFSITTGGVQISVKSNGLKIGNTSVTQSGGATVTFDGTKRTLKWNGSYKGKTARGGLALTHSSSVTAEYDTANGCLKIPTGTGITTIDARKVTTTISSYERCGNAWTCPKAGTITATSSKSGLSISIKYLGSGQATLTGPSGKTWDYKMLWCTP
jgi:hypothetical protein